MNSLHPAHLADLERSGLTLETIRSARIYTVPPGEIGKKLKGGDGSVVSLLAFPYPGCDGYERFKVWYEEGKERNSKGKPRSKYRQPKDSPNHLYLPATVDLEGNSPLLVVEGEKKTLAVWQSGFQVVGIGGIWNWCEKGEDYKRPKESRAIPDLNKVNWRRSVTICFDSEGHNPNPKPGQIHSVRLAAFRLTRELSRRGAKVSILFIPIEEVNP